MVKVKSFWVLICILSLCLADEFFEDKYKNEESKIEVDVPMLLGLGIFESGPQPNEDEQKNPVSEQKNPVSEQNKKNETENDEDSKEVKDIIPILLGLGILDSGPFDNVNEPVFTYTEKMGNQHESTEIPPMKRKNKKKNNKDKMKIRKQPMNEALVDERNNITEETTKDTLIHVKTTEDAPVSIIITKEVTKEVVTEAKIITNAPTIPEKYITEATTQAVTESSICQAFQCEIYDDTKLIMNTGEIITNEGQNLTLHCTIETENSNFKPIINWDIKPYTKEEKKIYNQASLKLNNVGIDDSGIYVCFIISDDGCCNKTAYSLINVYQVPNYYLHIIIILSICAAQLCICIPFVWNRRKTVKYVDPNKETEDEEHLLT